MKKLLVTLLVLLFAVSAFAASDKWSNPATNTVTITASDSTEYNPPLKAVYLAVAGTIRVVASADASTYDCSDAPLFGNHPVGYLKVRAWKVCSTGTAATGLTGLAISTVSVP